MSFDPSALSGLMGGFQQRLAQIKEEAAEVEVEGQAGGGLVKVIATGRMEVVSVSILEMGMDDRELLEDMLVAATNDALRQARAVMAQKLQALTGGLPIPPGLLDL